MLKQKLERGSVLILSSFLILAVSIISLSYWKLIEVRVELSEQKKQAMRAGLAARAGLEDAIYELKQGNSWDLNGGGLSNEWKLGSGNTFYKSRASAESLSFVSYPMTYYVKVEGDISEETVTINATGEVSVSGDSLAYNQEIQARISQSFNGNIMVHSIKEKSE